MLQGGYSCRATAAESHGKLPCSTPCYCSVASGPLTGGLTPLDEQYSLGFAAASFRGWGSKSPGPAKCDVPYSFGRERVRFSCVRGGFNNMNACDVGLWEFQVAGELALGLFFGNCVVERMRTGIHTQCTSATHMNIRAEKAS